MVSQNYTMAGSRVPQRQSTTKRGRSPGPACTRNCMRFETPLARGDDQLRALASGGVLARGVVDAVGAGLAEAEAVRARPGHRRGHVHFEPLAVGYVVEHRPEL